MVATVGPWPHEVVAKPESSQIPGIAQSLPATDGPRPRSPSSVGLAWGAGAVLCLGLVGAIWFYGTARNGNRPIAAATARVPQRSIAVLPFLDLTEAMDEEPFADGMTEELINRLGRIPDLRVPAPRSSFYFKGKHLPVAVIAESLGVAYVLDGSVRKSGSRLRVAARLVRADDGYVAWSESYDRPFDDILMVQDDIAGEVTKALMASIDVRRARNEPE
jgi:TolB-like protein